VTGGSYDAIGLNWTTVYEFKARRVSGSTYYPFGDILKLFCACGQGFVYYPNDVPKAWQQGIDVFNGLVTMTVLPRQGTFTYFTLYRYNPADDTIYAFIYKVETDPYHYTEPMQTRVYDNRRFMLNGVQFFMHDGINLFKTEWVDDGKIACDGIAINSSGRVIIGFQTGSGASYDLSLAISHDWGETFADLVQVISPSLYYLGALAEAGDGAVWFAIGVLSGSDTDIKIYKYIEGVGITLVRTLINATFPKNIGYKSISASGTKIVVSYFRYIVNIPPPNTYPKMISISTDNGASWTEKEMTLVTDLSYLTNYGPVCICDGNLIIFGLEDSTGHFALFRSTDDGDSWTKVFDLDGYYLPYPEYAIIRSHGTDAVFVDCGFSDSEGGNVGYLFSGDSGATWTYKLTPESLVGPM
jgi:hypothetical protein